MPVITNVYQIDVSPERFLSACSPSELKELWLLLQRPDYQAVIEESPAEVLEPDDPRQMCFPYWNEARRGG